MAVTEAQMRASAKYKKEKVKRVALEIQNAYWDETLKPAIEASGMSTNGFIKKCIAYYLENMGT